MGEGPRNFDLNLEQVLEHWTVVHAIREIIANALDEWALTPGTTEPELFKDERSRWHIKDGGRGLRYDHLTQNESPEKLADPDKVVGKFGVGLKDALASFDRHGVRVQILSPHGDITTRKAPKHGFEDVSTLHAVIDEASEPTRIGTEVILDGVTESDIEESKQLFLHYAREEVLERTPYGTVLRRGTGPARIYVNGLRVAEEPNFLFSYNITSPTKALREALNRERSHVGKSAYTERVKDILHACETPGVAEALAADLGEFQAGAMHDELQWMDVATRAAQILNGTQGVIFLTPTELEEAPGLLSLARGDGYRPIIVPDSVRSKLPTLTDIAGQPIRDLHQYATEWNESFQFELVAPEALRPSERAIWARTDDIFDLAGGRPAAVYRVRISETMRIESYSHHEAVGLWEAGTGCITIKRSQLSSLAQYAGTLLHELAHASSGASDVTAAFENALTQELGQIAARHLQGGERNSGNASAAAKVVARTVQRSANDQVKSSDPPEASGDGGLVEFLAQRELEVVDKRAQDGFLWVIGGRDLQPFFQDLEKSGLRFTFASNGGRSTQHRPAWYTGSAG